MGMKECYYVDIDGAIVMFDTGNRTSYKNAEGWYNSVRKVGGKGVHIILCGNKVEIAKRQVLPKHISLHRKLDIPYHDISVRSNFNFEKPFLTLARKLTGHKDLIFTDRPALPPPEVHLDEEDSLAQHEKELSAWEGEGGSLLRNQALLELE